MTTTKLTKKTWGLFTVGAAVLMFATSLGCQPWELAETDPGYGCDLVGTAWGGVANEVYFNDPSNTDIVEDEDGNPITVAFLGIDEDVSELLIAMTFDGVVHVGGLSVWADMLTGGIDGITGEADHEGWFAGHCSVTDNATGMLTCEVDDPSTGFNRDFFVFVDDMTNPTLLTADEPFIHLNAPVIGNVFFTDSESATDLTLTPATWPTDFATLDETQVDLIGGSVRFDLTCSP